MGRRAADVEAQASGPIMNPVEMAMPNEKAVDEAIGRIPRYVEMFQVAFPGEEPAISRTWARPLAPSSAAS